MNRHEENKLNSKNRQKNRRNKNIYKIYYKFFSYGGSAVSYLINKCIEYHINNDKISCMGNVKFKHRRNPPEFNNKDKIIYVFSNPMNAALSFFNRKKLRLRFPINHSKNLGGISFKRKLSLEKYLNIGVDNFKLEDHWNRWVNHDYNCPYMLLRYETMHKYDDQISEFLNIPKGYLEYKNRKSDWTNEPENIKNLLYKMYNKFHEKILEFPEIIVKEQV